MKNVDLFNDTLDKAYKFLNELPFKEVYSELPDISAVQGIVSELQRLSLGDLKAEFCARYDGLNLSIAGRAALSLHRWVKYDWVEGETVLFQPRWVENRLAKEAENCSEKFRDFYMGQLYLINDYIIDRVNGIKAMIKEFDEPASQEPATGRELPSELDTEQARKYFARAVAAGLISEQFEWLASQSLLACFCREMSVNLDLGKGYSSDGQPRLSWKPFERLFGVSSKRLATSLNDIKKTGQNPIGIEKVEAIFND